MLPQNTMSIDDVAGSFGTPYSQGGWLHKLFTQNGLLSGSTGQMNPQMNPQMMQGLLGLSQGMQQPQQPQMAPPVPMHQAPPMQQAPILNSIIRRRLMGG